MCPPGYRPYGPPFPQCSGDANADCINGCATGHVLSARVCQDGTWVCPVGTTPASECPVTLPVDAGAQDAGPDAITCGDGSVACADAGSD
jgi:hypothetical protein